jgi:hypothetical protein
MHIYVFFSLKIQMNVLLFVYISATIALNFGIFLFQKTFKPRTIREES